MFVFFSFLTFRSSCLQYPFPTGRRQLRKWFDKMSAVFYASHGGFRNQAFDLATVRMRALLREDQPNNSWNVAEDDEFQRLEGMTGVIYENEVEQTTLRYESCGSSTSIVNLSDVEGDD